MMPVVIADPLDVPMVLPVPDDDVDTPEVAAVEPVPVVPVVPMAVEPVPVVPMVPLVPTMGVDVTAVVPKIWNNV